MNVGQSSVGIAGHEGSLDLEVFLDEEAAAEGAARIIADEANTSVSERGRFIMAVSGGRTPWIMLRALAEKELSWKRVHIFQVDERVAPAGDADVHRATRFVETHARAENAYVWGPTNQLCNFSVIRIF